MLGYYIMIGVCALSMCLGQVLLKVTSNALQAGGNYLDQSVFVPFAIAIIIYGVATLGWVWALKYVPISRAFPFVAISYIVIPLAGAFWFGEVLDLKYGVGITFIIAGVFMTSI